MTKGIAAALAIAVMLLLWMVIFDFWDRHEDELRRYFWRLLSGRNPDDE